MKCIPEQDPKDVCSDLLFKSRVRLMNICRITFRFRTNYIPRDGLHNIFDTPYLLPPSFCEESIYLHGLVESSPSSSTSAQ